jgi:hypothetical protein
LVAVDAVEITQVHTEMLVVVLAVVLAENIKAQFICHQQPHARLVLRKPVLQLLETEVLLLVSHQHQEVNLVETTLRTVTQFLVLVEVECSHTQVVA